MGRYITGDIEHKLMFAVQSSTAADRFGSTHMEPNHVNYYFEKEHLPTINKELEILKPSFDKVSKFFENKNGWTNKMLEEENISKDELSDYADYNLGIKIRDCILEQSDCQFEAEL